METSPPASNFRFRDHGDDMENGESVVGDTSSELSSVTSDEDSDIESVELASMTAKGINHLCLELIELKQASEVDFQDNIISNYSSFIRVFRETEGIHNEVMQLKYHLMSQKQLVLNLMDGAYLKPLSDDPIDTVVEEHELDDQNPTTFFKTCADEVLETLDNLLFEQRLEEALAIFEIEDGNSPKVKFQENISPDVWMCYKSDMAERRVMLADKLTLMADNTRISSAELQKSLLGLSHLGFYHLATRLLFKYYHTRIASGSNNLQSSSRFLPGIHIHDLAKYVFSMIHQASKSFVMLHGDTSPYDSELMKWACEETEAFASRFSRHVKLISQIGDGLSMVINSFHSAISYCSMLETQKSILLPLLIDHILPRIKDILNTHFDHFKKILSIFTSTDNWVMERYLVSEILTEEDTSSMEYCLLTNSGRKFISLVKGAIEDISSLVSFMGSSILEELMNLFTYYTSILQTALTHETNDPRIKMAESLSQKVSIFANLSTLEKFFFKMIRNLFKDMNELTIVIDDKMVSVADTFSTMRTQFCKKFLHGIMSNEASCTKDHIDPQDLMMPSLPYQIVFLEVRKVEELAENDVDEFDWLVSLLREIIETTLDYISRNRENSGNFSQQSAVDMEFMVEMARRGGYLTTNTITSSSISEIESAMIDYSKVMEAIVKEENWISDEEIEEYQPCSSFSELIEEDDEGILAESETSNLEDEEVEEEMKRGKHKLEKMSMSRMIKKEDVVIEDEIKEDVSSTTTSDELLELRKIRRVSKVVREKLK